MTIPNEFFVRIILGNDAMSSAEQIAETLRIISYRINDENLKNLMDGHEYGLGYSIIRDINGNTVGSFGYKT